MEKTTSILHSIPVDELTGAISVPIYQAVTYVQQGPGIHKGYEYGRTRNPTRDALETIAAKMESGVAAYAFTTGLAAIDTVLKLLSTGDEIISVDDVYGGTHRLFEQVYRRFGMVFHYTDSTDVENVTPLINDKTKLIWLESPTNPMLKISDIATIAKIAHAHKALLVVDNTFASPVAQNPLLLGADIVVHSATKSIGGHSDVLAGLVVVNTEELSEKIKFLQNSAGGVLAPHDSWLTIRGIETLTLRVRQQCASGMAVARFLANHPLVGNVYYPGLETHKNHEIARRQQNGLYGGMVSFNLADDTLETATRFVKATKLFKLAESLGSVKSLISLPSEMTHKSVPAKARKQSGILDSLIRLSCGIEETEDLIQDLEQAFTEAVRS